MKIGTTRFGSVAARARIGRWTRRLVLATVIAACVFCVWPTRLGGRTAMIVVEGNSMEPAYSQGDLVIARRQQHYEPGDIVVFRIGSVGSRQAAPLVIHRILAEDAAGIFTTQGDNRTVADGFRVTSGDIVGRAMLRVPSGGSVLHMLSRWWTLGLITGLITVLWLWPEREAKDGVDDRRSSGAVTPP